MLSAQFARSSIIDLIQHVEWNSTTVHSAAAAAAAAARSTIMTPIPAANGHSTAYRLQGNNTLHTGSLYMHVYIRSRISDSSCTFQLLYKPGLGSNMTHAKVIFEKLNFTCFTTVTHGYK